MKFYAVHHNLTAHTAKLLDFKDNQDIYRQVFTTKTQATQYARSLKQALLALVREKQAEYRSPLNSYYDTHTKVSPTRLIKESGVNISVESFSLNCKEDIAKALSNTALRECHNYDEECGTWDHHDCAVFFFDTIEADTRNNAVLREPSYED
jgi:hypothetical protein